MGRFDRIMDFRLGRNFFRNSATKFSTLHPVFVVIEFIMPLLLGIAVGWLGAVSVGYYISPKSAELQLNMAASIAAAQNRVDSGSGFTEFLTTNPFGVSAFPAATSKAAEAPREVINADERSAFAKATLSGTFPALGVWLHNNTNNKLNFLMIGENFEAYKLTEVYYDRAIFQDSNNNNVTKYFYILEENSKNTTTASAPPAPVREVPATQPVVNATVASVSSSEGAISREEINKLLMNPFDEMKKFRIRPKFEGSESVGIEVQWIQSDSVLGKLGVLKNDVIKSVNGIQMKNMGDIANAINSLMSSSHFDVEVLRSNAPTTLKYAVK